MQALHRLLGSLSLALFLGIAAMTQAVAVPMLSLSSTPTAVLAGGNIALDVTASGFTDLYGYEFTLNFNPTVFRATSVAEGPFLRTGGATFFDGGSIDNTAGAISFIFDTLIGPGAGVTGSGVLSRITFNALRTGVATFSLTDVLALDSNLQTIAVQTQTLALAVPEPGVLVLLCAGMLGMRLRAACPGRGARFRAA